MHSLPHSASYSGATSVYHVLFHGFVIIDKIIIGTFGFSKMDVFLENFRRGGVISDPKKYIADFFGFKTVYFGCKFGKKFPKRGGGGGSSPIQKNSLQIYAS